MATDRMFLVMRLQSWNSLGIVGLPFEVSTKVEEGMPTNWLPVFTDRARAEEWAEGKYQVAEIQAVRDSTEDREGGEG